MPFKKSLTPLGKKGRIVTNRGKGSTVERTVPGQRESVTGGDPLGRMLNQYPAAPQPGPTQMPADLMPKPTAAMPGSGVPDPT